MERQLFGSLRMPVIAAPMFLISDPDLVVASCEAGIIGTFPALNQRTTEGFDQWLFEIKQRLKDSNAPHKQPVYGVNLIVHGTNTRLREDVGLCIKHQVPLVITSLGAVSEVVEAVHSYGGKVFHDITNRRHAQKAIEAGVDGLILVCGGAGGHAGTAHPMPFVKEIRSMFEGPIILSGAISTGSDIYSAMAMGADYAYMGTRFINTIESKAQQEYKQMICTAQLSDVVYTPVVSGIPANFLKPSLENNGISSDQWKQEGKIDFGDDIEHEIKAWKTVWSAGQGVASIQDILSVSDLVDQLEQGLQATHRRMQQIIG